MTRILFTSFRAIRRINILLLLYCYYKTISTFTETATDDVVGDAERDEGVLVDVFDEFFHLAYLETGHGGIKDLLGVAGVASFAVQECDATVHLLHECLADCFVLVGDNHDDVALVETFDGNIDRLADNVISKKRVHGLVPAEDEAGCGENEEVQEHLYLPYGEDGLAVGDDGDNVRAVEETAESDDDADTETVDETAKDGCKEGIIGDGWISAEECGEKRQQRDGDDAGDREAPAHATDADEEERQVEEQQEGAEGHAGCSIEHDRDADDTAIDDLVRDEEEFKADGGKEGPEGHEEVFLAVEGLSSFFGRQGGFLL